jgi:putative transposase
METKTRSGWGVKRTLRQLGVSPASYYRWRKAAQGSRSLPPPDVKPVQVYEATAAEKSAVRSYALRHPGVRHRELAWRMVDEGVACLSMSTVYRILKEKNLVCPWRRRTKRSREAQEKASRPDAWWATDLMHVTMGGRTYYLVTFLDEYSRASCVVVEHGWHHGEHRGSGGDRKIPSRKRRRSSC